MDDNILTLVAGIERHLIVLPDIQRSFVWDEDQTYAFFDSLFRGYPVGVLLFWKVIGRDEDDHLLIYHDFIRDYRRRSSAQIDKLAQG